MLHSRSSLGARPFLKRREGPGGKRERANPSSLDFAPELLGLAPRLVPNGA